MTEEEKKITKRLKDDIALVTFNSNLNYGIGNLYVNINDLKIILNLISKLQADIDRLEKKNKRYEKYLKNKDEEHEKVLEFIENEKEKQQSDIEIKDKVIEKIKSELQKHINFCEQESRGHLENKVWHISLKFEKNLLEEVEKVGGEDEK